LKSNLLSGFIFIVSAFLTYVGFEAHLHETALQVLSLACFFSGGLLVDSFIHKFILKGHSQTI